MSSLDKWNKINRTHFTKSSKKKTLPQHPKSTTAMVTEAFKKLPILNKYVKISFTILKAFSARMIAKDTCF